MIKDFEMNQLSLRKQKLNNLFNQKRKIDWGVEEGNKENIINPNDLEINAETKAFFIKDIENIDDIVAIESKLSSHDIHIRNYTIYLLRMYFINHNPTNTTLIKEYNLTHILMEILSSDKSINVQNEIYWILANYSYCEGKANYSNNPNCLDMFSKKYILVYNNSLSLNNRDLSHTIIHFMLNISFYSLECRYALFNNNTLGFLFTYFNDNNNNNYNEGNKSIINEYNYYVILLLGILVKKQKNISEITIEKIYSFMTNIILKQTKKHLLTTEIVFCCLFGLVSLSDYINNPLCTLFARKVKEDTLIDFILNYNYDYKYNNDNESENEMKDNNNIPLKYSIQLLTNLLTSEDINMSEYLLSKNILDFLFSVLQSNQSSIIILQILSTIRNLSVGLIDEINQLISHPIFKQCTTLLSHHKPDIKIKVLIIISNCLHYKLNEISMKIYSNELIDQLIDLIANDSDAALVLNSLNILLQFILSDKRETHFILNSIQEKHIEDLIEKHSLSKNNDICIISKAIIKQITFG